MNIQLLVTQTDYSLANLEKEMESLGLEYEIIYIEDNPELVASHKILHSPNILIDGKLAFRDVPTENELKAYIEDLT